MRDPPALLHELFAAAVAAADPAAVVPPHLPRPPRGRTVVVGAGKAAAAMARAVERRWVGELQGAVVTRYGHGVPTERIAVVEAGHPVPDAVGQGAARAALQRVAGLGVDDLVLCLLSGGGSALWAAPAPGVTLEDKRALALQLLRCGASIAETNAVRKHLSAIKGGRLALACHPAPVWTLAISDVPGDDFAVIASGPTVADPSTGADAVAVLDRYGLNVDARLRAALLEHETPKPGDPRLPVSRTTLVATPAHALAAAAARARALGLEPVVLGDALQGEARALGAEHAALARAHARGVVLLSGGETTVTVRGAGRGGRNAEYALGLGLALDGATGVWALAADTDGIDGTEDNAGCMVTPDTLARARAAGLDPARCLADNDAYRLFAALDALVITGPTRTDVNDFRAVLIAD